MAIATPPSMRDQKDSNNRQASQPQPSRPSNERKRRLDTLMGEGDEPQICRGID